MERSRQAARKYVPREPSQKTNQLTKDVKERELKHSSDFVYSDPRETSYVDIELLKAGSTCSPNVSMKSRCSVPT